MDNDTFQTSEDGFPASDLRFTLRRHFVDRFYAMHVPALPAGSRVLDLGGNRLHKRGRFNLENFPLHVVYANLFVGKRPDVQADAALLPFRRNSFDAVICAELLEHVYRPEQVLREIIDVLKPGGVLLLTAPFMMHRHADPADYGRYTGEFWVRLLTELGFEKVRVEAQGLFWSVILDMLRNYLVNGESARKRQLSRFGSLLLRRLVIWGRRRVRRFEVGLADNPFFSAYTTGFGVSACVAKAERSMPMGCD